MRYPVETRRTVRCGCIYRIDVEEIPMILIDGQLVTLADSMVLLRARYGVAVGPLWSSERS